MKKNLTILAAACVLLVAGCKTTPTQIAYQSISATETIVLTANSVYLDSVVTGQTATNSVPTVESAFNDTQLALHAAAAVASGGVSAQVPATVAVQASTFTNLVNSVIGKK